MTEVWRIRKSFYFLLLCKFHSQQEESEELTHSKLSGVLQRPEETSHTHTHMHTRFHYKVCGCVCAVAFCWWVCERSLFKFDVFWRWVPLLWLLRSASEEVTNHKPAVCVGLFRRPCLVWRGSTGGLCVSLAAQVEEMKKRRSKKLSFLQL